MNILASLNLEQMKILLGYSPHRKSYQCYNKWIGRIINNIDVVVDEKENTPR